MRSSKTKGGGAMSGIFSQVKEFDRDTLKSVETHITRADGKKVRHIGILEYRTGIDIQPLCLSL